MYSWLENNERGETYGKEDEGCFLSIQALLLHLRLSSLLIFRGTNACGLAGGVRAINENSTQQRVSTSQSSTCSSTCSSNDKLEHGKNPCDLLFFILLVNLHNCRHFVIVME